MATKSKIPRFQWTRYDTWHLLGISFAQFVHSSQDASLYLDLDAWYFGLRILVWRIEGKSHEDNRRRA